MLRKVKAERKADRVDTNLRRRQKMIINYSDDAFFEKNHYLCNHKIEELVFISC